SACSLIPLLVASSLFIRTGVSWLDVGIVSFAQPVIKAANTIVMNMILRYVFIYPFIQIANKLMQVGMTNIPKAHIDPITFQLHESLVSILSRRVKAPTFPLPFNV